MCKLEGAKCLFVLFQAFKMNFFLNSWKVLPSQVFVRWSLLPYPWSNFLPHFLDWRFTCLVTVNNCPNKDKVVSCSDTGRADINGHWLHWWSTIMQGKMRHRKIWDFSGQTLMQYRNRTRLFKCYCSFFSLSCCYCGVDVTTTFWTRLTNGSCMQKSIAPDL